MNALAVTPLERVNRFWFGRIEETLLPSERRARLWFGTDPGLDALIAGYYEKDLEYAVMGKYRHWQDHSRGQLALILLLDQFSRHMHRDTALAYSQDLQALEVCLRGIERGDDHYLSLIERVFFYFPLLHSEKMAYQIESIRAYQMLANLSFPETRVIYDTFLKFAYHHYTIIQHFGRFPQRNAVLGRTSTPEELEFLKELS